MSEFVTNYQKFESPNEDDTPANEEDYLMHVPNRNKSHWHHIEDLDGFFARVYLYHQNHGFAYSVTKLCLQIIEYLFMISLICFLARCVDYPVLFGQVEPSRINDANNQTLTFGDVIYGGGECAARISSIPFLVFCLIIAGIVLLFKLLKLVYNIYQLIDMKNFYATAQHIKPGEVSEVSWYEVQQRLMMVQKEQQMCIHKQNLTELDIYNRILRFKNYMIALTNKGLIPPRFKLPLFGEILYYTDGLEQNIEFLFFRGPCSVFVNNYHMKDEYKQKSRRIELSHRLSKYFLWLGIANLLLSPFIMVWQIWYVFLKHAKNLKLNPSVFVLRRWSLYGRLYLRHFNELPHEFDSRLKRAYKPATSYMDTFTSPTVGLFAETLSFIFGSLFIIVFALLTWSAHILDVEHVVLVITVLGLIATVSTKFVPDKYQASCPELDMRRVIAQTHYAPDNWRGEAHTTKVRDEFSQIFQYKSTYLFEGIVSPLITPFVLIFVLRKRSLEFVDFFRNFTVDIAGVGDVCSFAQLDVKKHGDPKWQNGNNAVSSSSALSFAQQADDGKTELSLMHFAVTNPKWRPPPAENQFLSDLKRHAVNDVGVLSHNPTAENPLFSSLQSAGSIDMLRSVMMKFEGNSIMQSQFQNQLSPTIPDQMTSIGKGEEDGKRGHDVMKYRGTTCVEGPVDGARDGLVSSILSPQGSLLPHASDLERSLIVQDSAPGQIAHGRVAEMTSLEMSVSALYMHELHHNRINNQPQQMMWETVAESDEGSCHRESLQSSVIERAVERPTSLHRVAEQPNYESTGILSSADIFGQTHQLSADAYAPTHQFSSPQGFLSTALPTYNRGDHLDLEGGTSNDQQFFPDNFLRRDHEATFNVQLSHSSPSSYQPPEV